MCTKVCFLNLGSDVNEFRISFANFAKKTNLSTSMQYVCLREFYYSAISKSQEIIGKVGGIITDRVINEKPKRN